MNWDTYKQLSFELRDEYKYRFGDEPQLSCRGMTTMLISLVSVISMLVFLSYLILTSEAFVDLKDMYAGIVKGTINIVKVGLSIILVYLLVDVIKFPYFYIRRWRWLKKHNIKRQKETFWW